MQSSAPDRGYSPLPGETPLALITLSVLLGISTAALLAALIASAFVAGLGTTVVAAVVCFTVAAIGFVVVLVQRRNYLRDVAIGRVVEREPWSGAELLPPV
jgi:hypothetical protein